MSSSSPTHCSGKLEKQYAFKVTLTVYSSLKLKMKGKTSVLKEVKSIKTKELSFPLKVDNYLDFLQGVLDKHGQDHYKILERKQYSFKCVPPKTKGQHVSNVMDIDNEADYQEMVGKVSSIHPSTTKIFVDMKQVEKLPLSESGDEAAQALVHPAPPATPTININSLTSVLLLQMLTKSGLLSSLTPVTPATPAPPLVTPT
ncbi:hypothetical protein EDC04DRAFT_2910321 [Pisolithus marmoratus]|nr:hypothetical protein EDC04DRAFT_2910321 [Pisolithus marmoratus]